MGFCLHFVRDKAKQHKKQSCHERRKWEKGSVPLHLSRKIPHEGLIMAIIGLKKGSIE